MKALFLIAKNVRKLPVFGVLVFLFVHFQTLAQTSEHFFIDNHYPEQYSAHGQNWAIAQMPSGIMCFANSYGLLMFDGISWNLLEMPNKSVVRSLATDKNGVLYVGAQNELGFVRDDSLGQAEFVSLKNKIPEHFRSFDDIWGIHVASNGTVFFEAAEEIFVFSNNKVTVLESKSGFHSYFLVNDTFYVREWEKGLMTYDGKQLIPAPGGSFFSDIIINAMIDFGEKKILIVTKTNGMFMYDFSTNTPSIKPYLSDADEYLSQNQVYSFVSFPDGRIGICTITGGLVVLDKNAQTNTIISESEGLCDNEVYCSYVDKHGSLWVGTGGGISRIDIDNPMRKIDKFSGLEGSVYCAHRYEGVLYIGTSQGLYKENANGKFRKIELSTGQCWSLFEARGKLLAAHTNGFYLIENDKFNFITDISSWSFSFVDNNQESIVVGTDEYNLISAKWSGRTWIFNGHISNFKETARFLEKDDFGYFWASAPAKGIWRFKLNSALTAASDITFFGINAGLPSNYNNRVFKQKDGSLIFTTEKGLYRFDYKKNKFYPDALNEKFGIGNTVIYYHKEDASGNIGLWVSEKYNSGRLLTLVVLKKEPGDFVKISKPFFKIGTKNSSVPVDFDNTINFDKNGKILLSGQNSVYTFDLNHYVEQKKPFSVVFRSIKSKTKIYFNKGISQYESLKNEIIVPYSENDFRFEFATDFFENTAQTEFYYKLSGSTFDSVSLQNESSLRLSNLREGSYKLEIFAQNIYQETSKPAVFLFSIRPPWYRTIWAYIGYSMLILTGVFLFHLLYSRKTKKEKEYLEQIIGKRTEEVQRKNIELELQKEEIRKHSDNLKDANYKMLKQKEVVEKAYSNIKMLSSIGQEISSHLSIPAIIEKVYETVNKLMDASVFSIGIYNEALNRLDFDGTKEKGKNLPFHFDDLNDDNLLSVRCFKFNIEILIHHYTEDYKRFFAHLPQPRVGELPESIIYIPLSLKSVKHGVLSVQSFKKSAYSDYHLDLIRNIGIYTWIALENATIFRKMELQKKLIESQNEDINSGIRYAKTIQQAILPTREMISSIFENFIIYRPKEIVSGDFYWFNYFPEQKMSLAAVMDCTGHGIGGAFMSLIGNRLLTDIVNGRNIYDPATILTQLDKEIRIALKQDVSDNTDGLDACVVLIEDSGAKKKMTYAGAKRPLFCFKDGQSIILMPSRRSVGGYTARSAGDEFKNTILELSGGDTLYLTSDGFADQNSPDRRRMGSEKLVAFLSDIQLFSPEDQALMLIRELENFAGGFPQMDDITVLCLKL